MNKIKKICLMINCNYDLYCKGYCRKHYARWRAHGDPCVNLKPRNSLCSIDGCGKKHEAKGFCPMHYWRFMVYKNPNHITSNSKTGCEKILTNHKKDNITLCWIWAGTIEKNNYGSCSHKGKIIKAHRLSYLSFIGDIPSGMIVCHKCDNPSCVNPDHLFIGTHKDNMQDKVKKGRCNMPKGELHYTYKRSVS